MTNFGSLIIDSFSCFVTVKAGAIVAMVTGKVGCAVLCCLVFAIWRKNL